MEKLIAKIMKDVASVANGVNEISETGVRGKENFGLLNKADLIRRKFRHRDIKELTPVWMPGRSRPLYDMREAQRLIDKYKA